MFPSPIIHMTFFSILQVYTRSKLVEQTTPIGAGVKRKNAKGQRSSVRFSMERDTFKLSGINARRKDLFKDYNISLKV